MICRNICRPAKRVEMKKTQFLNRRFDAYNTRRRWSVHFPNSFRQVPRRLRPEEAELVLCQRLSLISNMASIATDGSSTELEVRYSTNCRKYSVCHCVWEITFVWDLFHFNDCYQQAVSVKKHSILFVHLICPIIIYVRLEHAVAYYLYRITSVIRDIHVII